MDRLEILRQELRYVIMEDLAKKLNLSYGCLYAIREGKTKWPRLKTLNLLLPELGLVFLLTYSSE